MTIKEAAAKTGLTEKTIRYYEAQGLIHPAMEEKNGRNFRTYTEKEVRELCNIAVLRKMRFTIEEIRQLQRKQTDTGMSLYRLPAQDRAGNERDFRNLRARVRHEVGRNAGHSGHCSRSREISKESFSSTDGSLTGFWPYRCDGAQTDDPLGPHDQCERKEGASFRHA